MDSILLKYTGLLFCLALTYPACVAAASDNEILQLKREIEVLQVEFAKSRTEKRDQGYLERRVKELEIANIAQEDAVRAIIKSSVSTLGSKINEFVTLGGALDMLVGRSKDFSGVDKTSIGLNTAEFDFEIKANDWALWKIVLEYVDGKNAVFSTTSGYDTSVDRINLGAASVTIGDTQKFPAFIKTGRMTLPFGTSTGVHRADVLSIDSPMTIEVFESRKSALGFGVAFPTPAHMPPLRPVAVPPVRPRFISPMITSLSKSMGYVALPTRPKPPHYVTAPLSQAPYNAAVYLYNGNESKSSDGKTSLAEHFNVTLGYTSKGDCGRAYDELRESWLCPWTMGFDVDYNSSIFDSNFLEVEYRKFLPRIGRIPGMAASVKGTMGPFSVVGEWNGATEHVEFLDDVGKQINIRPTAWQASLGYQFDWNPWVEGIGAQGSFFSLGYSESSDLAGVTRIVDTASRREGFVPKKRLLLTAGEWVLDGTKLAVEYSRNWDYPINEGGTGETASGLFTTLTYTW